MADERGPNGERLKPNLEKRMVRLAHNIFIDCDVQVLLYFLVHRPCVLALACPRFICACAVSPVHVLCVRGVAGTRGDAPGGVLGSAAGAPKRRRHATLGTRRSPQAGRGRGHHRGERTSLLRVFACGHVPAVPVGHGVWRGEHKRCAENRVVEVGPRHRYNTITTLPRLGDCARAPFPLLRRTRRSAGCSCPRMRRWRRLTTSCISAGCCGTPWGGSSRYTSDDLAWKGGLYRVLNRVGDRT